MSAHLPIHPSIHVSASGEHIPMHASASPPTRPVLPPLSSRRLSCSTSARRVSSRMRSRRSRWRLVLNPNPNPTTPNPTPTPTPTPHQADIKANKKLLEKAEQVG